MQPRETAWNACASQIEHDWVGNVWKLDPGASNKNVLGGYRHSFESIAAENGDPSRHHSLFAEDKSCGTLCLFTLCECVAKDAISNNEF